MPKGNPLSPNLTYIGHSTAIRCMWDWVSKAKEAEQKKTIHHEKPHTLYIIIITNTTNSTEIINFNDFGLSN